MLGTFIAGLKDFLVACLIATILLILSGGPANIGSRVAIAVKAFNAEMGK